MAFYSFPDIPLAYERPLCAPEAACRAFLNADEWSRGIMKRSRQSDAVGGMVEDPACLLLRTQAEGTARNDMNGDDLFGLMSALG